VLSIADGSEIGILDAQGAWRVIPHNLTLRREILKARSSRDSGHMLAENPIDAYVQTKVAAASRSRRAASDAARTLRLLAIKWLRDVHDALDRQQIKLFTFLVGQQELLAQKSALQIAGKTQIVARLMVEELAFHGIRNAEDVATCLNGYDQTAYPEGSQWSFTRFYLPQAFDAGYRLVSDAAVLRRRKTYVSNSQNRVLTTLLRFW
jgi:hypothetical protein